MAEEKGAVEKLGEGAKKGVERMKEGAKSTVDKVRDEAKSRVDKATEDVKERLGMKPRDPYMDYGLLIIRIGLAMFMIHGFQKLTGLDGTAAFFANVGIPAAGVFAVIVGLVEFFGGLAMLLGVATRVAGALLATVLLVAILTVKLKLGWPAIEIDLAMLSMALGVGLAGPGKLSLREMLAKDKRDHILNKL